MANPIFSFDEYIPDGEPHVFGNRVYLYGSHDAEGGDRFCMRDYTVYSAPIDDLEHWVCHGITYQKSQDPRSTPEKPVDFYAPDCVQGNDGRYYLYYCAMGPNVKNFGPMSVAVSDRPEGPFSYLGDIRYPDGTPVMKFLTNDPAVLNDNGKIWLYYGWGLGRDFRNKWMAPVYRVVQSKLFDRPLNEIKNTTPSILSCAVVELEDDMLTVKGEPKAVLDSKTTADKDSSLYHHAFYEAASIRRFGELYYLIYSSGENCELAYATSRYPDRDFVYRGVIISNSDLGYRGNTKPKAAGGTIHGSIECIHGRYYVFYHRCTHNTDFSRQACAEPIMISADGTIEQVEMTTQGISDKPIPAKGLWQAISCCNLYNNKTSTVQGNGHRTDRPTIVCENRERFITAINNGTHIGYKYLRFESVMHLELVVRGSNGIMEVKIEENGSSIGKLELPDTTDWLKVSCELHVPDGVFPLFLVYHGKGKVDLLEFSFS